ncbi:zinc finger, CCHC-type containing protein [Tanacetum coccineum]
MHFLLMTLKVVYVLTTPVPELLEDDRVEVIRRRAKWENGDYICRGHILNGMSDPLFDIYQNVESAKELWDSLESKHMAEDASSKKFLVSNFNNYKMVNSRLVMEQFNELLRILGQYTQHGLKMDESICVSKESLRAQESEKGKGKEVVGPSVNMTEEGGKNKNNKQNKGKKRSFKENNVETRKTTQVLVVRERGLRTNHKTNVDAIAWWIDSGATTHVCKDRCWFKTYEPVEDESVLYMGDDHFAPVHGKGSIVLEFSYGISITLFNVLYVPKLRKNLIYVHVSNKYGYKQVYESDKYILSKSGVFVRLGYYNNGMFMLNLNKVSDDSGSVYMPSSTVVNSLLWHARLGHVHYKIMLEMSKDDLIPAIDENPEKLISAIFMQHHLKGIKRIIHQTTSPYTPQQNGVVERKNKALKEMVNSMLSCSGFSDGFWGETILMACYLFNRVPNKRNKTTPYESWFYVIKSNDSVSINSIIESRDVILDENRFSSIPRPKDIIPNSDESQRDDHSNDVPSETPEPRRGKRARKAKSYGSDFQLYLVEGSRDQIGSKYSYCYSIEDDHKTYNEAMQSRDDAFFFKKKKLMMRLVRLWKIIHGSCLIYREVANL